MTGIQFDALVDLIAALIVDHELDLRSVRSPSDIYITERFVNTARELLVTDSPTED